MKTALLHSGTQSIPLNVPAAEDHDGRTLERHQTLHHRSGSDGATWLGDELPAIQQQSHGPTHGIVLHENDVVDEALMVLEREVSDFHGHEAVGDAAGLLEPDGF